MSWKAACARPGARAHHGPADRRRTDSHVWAERYDRDLNDIFALQDEIAQAIVAALKIRLLPAEKKAIENRSTRDPAAYQIYLQGRYHFEQYGLKNLEIAIRFGRRALEIDPHYARVWALIAVYQSSLAPGGDRTSRAWRLPTWRSPSTRPSPRLIAPGARPGRSRSL